MLFETLSTGAQFSDCRAYRYALWRIWNPDKPALLFVMLNPSTADEEKNDPTVERCERRAKAMGYGGLRVANIFALRSTDPAALYKAADPIGPDNDLCIANAVVQSASNVICAWGSHGKFNDRGRAVLRTIVQAGAVPYFLKMTADGQPSHPLYIGYEVQPKPMEVIE